MKYTFLLLFLLAACARPAKSPAPEGGSTLVENEPPDLQEHLFATLPELEPCREMLLSDEGLPPDGVSVSGNGDPSILIVPCGPPPGTGAYGYPLALVAEWAAMENTPEGDMPLIRQAISFHERTGDGEFARAGFVTQAIPSWTDADLANGYLHLFYKYAGAGQCGLLTTYSSEAWRTPFEFREARERRCNSDPCEDEACYDPLSWDVVYSVWDQAM